MSGVPYRTTNAARTGAYSFYMGGRNYAYDAVGQTVVVPTWAESAALYFSSLMYSYDSPTIAYDYLAVAVGSSGTVLASGYIWNNGARGGWIDWRLPTISNVRPYRGGTLDVVILAYTDFSYYTWWYVDEVQFRFACGTQAAAFGSNATYLDGSQPIPEEAQKLLEALIKEQYSKEAPPLR